MKGIWFDGVHSYTDLNLVLSEVNIPPAIPKMTFIDIPGGDGSVDLTEALGEVKYKDREGSFTFTVFPSDDFEVKKRQVSNLLNGKRCKITVDKDPDYYWIGRCAVDEYASDKNLHQIIVTATVAPYKWKHGETVVPVYFCGKNLINSAKYTNVYDHTDAVYHENGTVYVKYTNYNSLMLLFDAIPVNPKNKYTFKYDVVGGDRIVISFFDKNGNNISDHASSTGTYNELYSGRYITAKNGLTITMTSDVVRIQIGLCAMNTVGEGNFNEYSNIQLEIGDTVTEYEPHTPTTDPQEVILTCGRKSVCPTIICTGDVTLTVDGNDFELGKGTHKILDFRLHEGDNPVTVSGPGAVAFIYQEGDL